MPDENSFEELINELKLRNIKHNSQDIIAITQLDNGRIIFLALRELLCK
jgi:filamentous hemagglutinin